MDKDFDLVIGIILIFVIGSGICGNILSLLVWTKGRRCKKAPGGIYLKALAISDTVALFTPALNETIRLVSHYNPAQNNKFLCKLDIVGRHFGLIASSWIVVSFTVDRALAIFRPTSSRHLFNKKGTIALMIGVFLASFLLNIPFGLVYGLKEEALTQPTVLSSIEIQPYVDVFGNNGSVSDYFTTESYETKTEIVGFKRSCWADRSSVFHMSRWYHWSMDVFLIFIIPFTLMTGSNLAVLYVVVRNRNKVRSNQESRVKAVTLRAVTISVVHCLTSGPFAMSVLIPGYYSRAFGIPNSFEYYSSTVILSMAYLNHAVNFLLYSVFGSEFRRDCSELIWKKKCTVHPEGFSLQANGSIGKNKTMSTTGRSQVGKTGDGGSNTCTSGADSSNTCKSGDCGSIACKTGDGSSNTCQTGDGGANTCKTEDGDSSACKTNATSVSVL